MAMAWRRCKHKSSADGIATVKLVSMKVKPGSRVSRGDTMTSVFHIEVKSGEIRNGTLKVKAYKGIVPFFPYRYDFKTIMSNYKFPLKKGHYHGKLSEKVPIYAFKGTYRTIANLYVNNNNNVACAQYDVVVLK